MTDALVKEYYSSQVRAEWRRLVKDPYHKLELDTTLHFLGKYLPPHGLVSGCRRWTRALYNGAGKTRI